MKIKGKYLIVLEGADNSGKTTLSHYICNSIFDGKCNILHSTFNKEKYDICKNQHSFYADFIIQSFSKKYYINNNCIILDRSYISDIIYGMLNYGSREPILHKYKTLDKLLYKIKRKVPDINIVVIYCNNSGNVSKNLEEIVNEKEHNAIIELYDYFFLDNNTVQSILNKYNVNVLCYDYKQDDANIIKTYIESEVSIDG